MTSTLFTPVNMESIKKKLQKATSSTKQQQYKFKPSPGETTVRIIPYRHGNDPFNLLYFHYDIAKRSALCPKTFGNECPICEFAEELRKVKGEENFKTFKSIASKSRVFIPVIVRGKEDEGVKFWGVGKNVYETLLNLFCDPDYGDMSHPTEGTDLVIKFTSPTKELKYGKIEVFPRRNKSQLLEDKNRIIDILKSVPNIFEVYPEQSYEELKKLLDEHINGSQDSSLNNVIVNDNIGSIISGNEENDHNYPITDLDREFEELLGKKQ